MKRTRLLSAVLVLLMVLSLLPAPAVQAAKAPVDFAGNRTVEFTFQSSDLSNYANGGRAAVDLYLRKNAPKWLSYTLGAKGYEVQLTYSFDFESFDDYTQKLSTLLTYHPGILYQEGKDLILVEEFEANALLGSLVQSLGNSQNLPPMARITQNTLTIGGESYDFPGQKIQIYPQTQMEILLRSLEVRTAQKDDLLERTLNIRISNTYTEHEQWQDLVRRCEKLGDVVQEDAGDVQNFQVTFQASNEQALVEKTSQCLGMPVGLSVQLTEATEDSCTYLRAENFLLTGFLEENGSFYYRYDCPQEFGSLTVHSDLTEIQKEEVAVDGELSGYAYVQARDQASIQFSYTAAFRFDSVSVHTDCASVFKKVQRTITLTAPTHAAQVYHEDIKSSLADVMPKGTVLEIYDQDQTRYYVLKFASWFWADIAEFTAAFLDTEIIRQDSWLPFGQSSYTEDILDTHILEGFSPAHSVRISYRFPGTNAEFSDTTRSLQVEYRYLNIIKLLVLVLALAVVVVAALLLVKRVKKALKARPPKEKKPKAVQDPEPAAKQFCGNCGAELKPEDAFCPNCGTSR